MTTLGSTGGYLMLGQYIMYRPWTSPLAARLFLPLIHLVGRPETGASAHNDGLDTKEW